ncbi:uncharacterized protein FOMMEDRAFT_162627 [Fomitiporia mediterranea MF3/22]|uniref:Uncharacterized protein n=1 Tax=Fomitiporia mediterranea (strain MF3/22) TaxID=694068 RepID=R7SFW4_FOMME|nr:uncharacterized protein FOMMEDRAFT_162627 [Fomitiporia mediterranea MF3/22]EJC97608.1 hypothetical protein FOMMEDRAFT_162627 [Fomitiporia mediterranea MF3/22]
MYSGLFFCLLSPLDFERPRGTKIGTPTSQATYRSTYRTTTQQTFHIRGVRLHVGCLFQVLQEISLIQPSSASPLFLLTFKHSLMTQAHTSLSLSLRVLPPTWHSRRYRCRPDFKRRHIVQHQSTTHNGNGTHCSHTAHLGCFIHAHFETLDQPQGYMAILDDLRVICVALSGKHEPHMEQYTQDDSHSKNHFGTYRKVDFVTIATY